MVRLLARIPRLERKREVSIVLLWSFTTASLYAQALYQRSVITIVDIAAVALVCLLGGAALADMGDALIGYIASMALSLFGLFIVATLPLSLWTTPAFTGILLYTIWIKILFQSVFPFAFIIYLAAAIIGSALGEKFVQP